ncbi:MAG: SpaA isopeptide-forming pilin-related protein [Faecousia sp.]
MIYEIVTGLRDATTFELKDSNGYTDGDVFYNAGVANVSYFAPNYNFIEASVQAALKIPSFTSKDSSSAPTITLTGTTTTVTDSNGVLSNFTFTNGSGASFSKSGNSLTITQTGTISESTVFKASRYLPSADSSSFAIYYSAASTYQTCVKLYTPSGGNLNAYFKLKAPALGAISLTKTTEDGKNLSGWRFGIYSDSACTSLVSGPYTTDSSGKISVTGLSAGTYYVKELGHTDSSINALYICSSTNPQKVTVTSGGTASVSFYNKLNTSGLNLSKTTEDGKNLSGWKFGIYSDAACTALISGPHTTDSNGAISVTGLTPGTVYVKELGHTDSAIDALYTCASTNPQKVTLTAGQTASVSFQNKLNTGSVKLVKTTNTGENLGGWQIGLYTDSACTSPVSGSPFTTGEDGTVTVTGLQPGTLYAKELAGSDPYWECNTAVKTVTIAADQTATVTFSNTHNGRVKLIKSMPDGGSAAGWVFDVYRVSDGTHIGTYTSGEDGTILTDYLLPGEYKIEEQIPEGSPYICEGSNPRTVTIEAGKTAEVTFTNRLKPGEIMVQKVDTQGNPLAGAEFLLEWSVDGSQWAPVTFTDSLDVKEGTCTSEGLTEGKLTSGADGVVRFTGLHPQRLYRLTETKAPEGYQLLTEPVHESGIQVGDEFFVQLTVVNALEFELPMTGSMGNTVQNGLQIAGALILLALLIHLAKKRR